MSYSHGSRYATVGVLAGAYRTEAALAKARTHVGVYEAREVSCEPDRLLCRGAEPDNCVLVPGREDDPPTCPTCAKRDPRRTP